MVEKLETKGTCLFICQMCRFAYKDEKLAGLCEEWCKKHNTCNIEITKHGEVLEDT